MKRLKIQDAIEILTPSGEKHQIVSCADPLSKADCKGLIDFGDLREHRKVFAMPTDQKRPPKKGEWYISGAVPYAYKAKHDLPDSALIAELVYVQKAELHLVRTRLSGG